MDVKVVAIESSQCLKEALKNISDCITEHNDVIRHCESFLPLAEFAQSNEFFVELRKFSILAELCELLKFKSSDNNELLFCKSLLICIITSKGELTAAEAKRFELPLSQLLNAFKFLSPNNSSTKDCMISFQLLPKPLQDKSLKLCESIVPSCDIFHINEVDGTYFCLRSLQYMCSYIPNFLDCDFFCSSIIFQVVEKYTLLTESTSSLMEKLLICFIETCYSNLDCKFELCLISLELMVNITEFQLIDRKTFAKLCLMKFNFGNTAHLTLEILIKILTCSLERIVVLGNLEARENNQPQPDPDDLNTVYQVAEEHMEHSFICSYICVFISYFCDIKEPFFAYVCERLSLEMAEGTIIIMSKFKDFIPLMGRQNGQAFNMLNRATRIFLRMVELKRSENLDVQSLENNRTV